MDTVYVLISGEYSDWGIMGFAETEEEAKKICEYKNSVKSRYADDWYYEEVDKCKIEFSPRNGKHYYTFRFFQENDRSWVMDKDWKHIKIDEDYAKAAAERDPVFIYDVDRRVRYRAEVNVLLDDENVEKAKKIAQDKLYQRLGEVELKYREVPTRYIYTFLFERKEGEPEWRLPKEPNVEVSDTEKIKYHPPQCVKFFQIGHSDGVYRLKMNIITDVYDEKQATADAWRKMEETAERGRTAGLKMFGAAETA